MHSPQGFVDNRIAAARAFARSLNILLKCVRLYGADHKLTAGQFTTAWNELRAALPTDPEAGFLLGVSGHKLLVDGVPLECGPAERGFAQLLSAAGVASLYFSGKMKEGEFLAVVDAFAKGGSKPSAVAEQLKRTLSDPRGGIRVNEIRYVAQDANNETLATALTARVLGADADKVKDWLNDPQKLLQLIAAAQGSKQGTGGDGTGTAGPGAGPGMGPGAGGAGYGGGSGSGTGAPLQESDYEKVVRLLAQIGDRKSARGAVPSAAVREGMKSVSGSAQAALQQVLADLSASRDAADTDSTLLVKAAEHLAIRFALDQYARGDVKVNAVREMLDRMGKEIESLRKVIGSHEEKLGKAGIMVESHADILDRAFWAQVPEHGKRTVLLSEDAWCIPPRNLRSYLEDLLVQRNDVALITSILRNYSRGIKNADAEARRKTAMGVSDLADMYGRIGQDLLAEAVRLCGEQLQVESTLDLQTLLGAALVRLAQEAGTRPDFPALRQAMACVEKIESGRPSIARDIRRRIAVESRLRKFIVDAAHAPSVSPELLELLQQNRRAAAEEMAVLYSRSSRRNESERLVEMARHLGPEAIGRLRELLRARPAHEAIATLGLLAHLDATALLEWLPRRLPEWSRSQHDAVVRQIAASGVADRARVLVTLLDQLDPAVVPEVIDEIGMSGDLSAGAPLQKIAQGDLPSSASPYLQVKAIEALARLRDMDSLPLLRILLQSRSLFGWKQPREIRAVAAQALAKLDPEFLKGYLPQSGLSPAELDVAPLDPQPETAWVRQRRYPRIVPGINLNATALTQRGRYPLQIKTLSLGGGMGTRDGRSSLGMEAVLDLQLGLRHLRSQVWMREVDALNVGFEIVNIDLDDRAKLRKLLAEQMQRVPSGVLMRAQAPAAANSAIRVS
ncbi:MAG: hypothetical protein LAN37_12855 [Acidobacteriia bacterium]|nr:hypothetical protein [Terriglobia bacterium]